MKFLIFLNILIFIITLALKFPGIFTVDSLVVIEQIINNKFDNYHPAFLTIIFSFIYKIFPFPFILLLFQYGIFLYFIYYYNELLYKLKISYPKRILLNFFIIFNPVNLIYNLTFWKDIIFTNSLFLFQLTIFELIFYKKISMNKFFFILITILIATSRHNGFFIFISLFFYLILIKSKKIKSLIRKNLLTSLIIYILINTIFINSFNVKKIEKYNTLIPLIHNVFGVIANNGNISEKDIVLFSKIVGRFDPKTSFVCHTSNYFVFNPYFNKNYVANNFNKIFFRSIYIIINNPQITIGNIICKGLSMIGTKTHFILLLNSDKSNFIINKPLINNIFLIRLEKFFDSYIIYSLINPLMKIIFWKAIIPLIISVFLIFYFKKIRLKLFILFLPLFLNFLILIPIAPASDYRYVYYFQIIYYLLPLILLINKNYGKK